MTDTPDHVKRIHLAVWLSKSPGERLRQFLVNNDEFYKFCSIMQENMQKKQALVRSNPS